MKQSDCPDPLALVVGPSEAARMLDCSRWYIYALMSRGELAHYAEGPRRKITIASIRARIERKLAEAGDPQ